MQHTLKLDFNEQCPIVSETVSAPNGTIVDTFTLFLPHISEHAATGAHLFLLGKSFPHLGHTFTFGSPSFLFGITSPHSHLRSLCL